MQTSIVGRMRRFGRYATVRAVALALLLVSARPGVSQTAASTAGMPTVPLFTRDDAYLGLLMIAGTAALAPFDRRIAEKFQSRGLQNRAIIHEFATTVKLVTYPGALYIGASLYAIGRLGHSNNVADLGLHGSEAIAIGSVVNDVLKDAAGRARPYAVADTNPRDFQLLRGLRKGRDYSSFPSGHALTAFAAAAAVTNESGRWWRGAQWYVGPVLYAGAVGVAFDRLYDNQHWASDVIMGAGIGIFAGNKVVRFNHRTHPGNRLDHWLLGASVVPGANGGLKLAWSLLPR